MGVHFILRRGEIFRVLLIQNMARLKRNAILWCFGAAVFYLALEAVTAIAADVSVRETFSFYEFGGLILLFLFAAALQWFCFSLIQLFDMGKQRYYEERDIVLGGEGLEILKSGRVDMVLSYEAVREIFFTWNFILIRRAYARRMDWLEVIPRRAFRYSQEEDAFVLALKEKCGAPGEGWTRDQEGALLCIRFNLSAGDWLEALTEAEECRRKFDRERKRGLAKCLALPLFFLLFVAAGLFEMENSAPMAAAGLILIILIFCLRLIFTGKNKKFYYRRMLRQGRLSMEQASEWNLSFFSDEMIAEYGMTRHICPFECLQDAAETEHYLFLFERTGEFYPVPRSAMREEEKNRLWEIIEKKL